MTRDIEALDGGHDKPAGLWSDGATLWVLENGDGADDAIYAYDLETGERVEDREFKLDETNRAPRGVWSDRTVLWVSDSGRNRLFAHNLASGERLPERDIAFAERNRDARGIWSDSVTVWVSNHDPKRLFAYPHPRGRRPKTRNRRPSIASVMRSSRSCRRPATTARAASGRTET